MKLRYLYTCENCKECTTGRRGWIKLNYICPMCDKFAEEGKLIETHEEVKE